MTQPQAGGFTAVAVDSGVKFGWGASSGNLGYRVFRSASQGGEGVSITDFAISGTSFVDVNVDPNTTYYYTLYAVIKEATASGEREQLSAALGTATVKTGATILGGGKQKGIILMKLNDQNMSVNGKTQPIDPGNTTAPVSMNGRTMVPFRAIIEAMGGTVGWEQATSKITLSANGHNVTMWLNKKEIVVDGANKTMDVVPQAVNGRTLVPVRFAAENVGCAVDWIGSTSEIVIVFYTGGGGITPPATPTTPTTPTTPEPTTPTQPTTPEPTKPTQTDNSLIGVWSASPELPIEKSDMWIEFKSDGAGAARRGTGGSAAAITL